MKLNGMLIYTILFIIQNAPQHLVTIKGMMEESGFANTNSAPSLVSQSFGSFECLKKTQVTIFMADFIPRTYWDGIYELMDFLMEDSPCFELFVFENSIRRSVPWEEFKANSYRVRKVLSNKEIVGLIQDEFHVEENRPNTYHSNKEQTVLFFRHHWHRDYMDMLRELEMLDNKDNWKVIIGCHVVGCPVSQTLPIQRVAAEWDLSFEPKTFIDLIRNPNFNKFDYLKHVKLDDDRLKCLTNKSIHIQDIYTLALLENIALLFFNTDELISTKFFLYFEHDDNIFMKHFFRMNGFFSNSNNNRFNLRYIYDIKKGLKESLTTQTDNVYLIQNIFHLSRFCRDQSLSISGRKSFVFYVGIQPSCRHQFHKVTVKERKEQSGELDRQSDKKHFKYVHDIQFIDDVLNASCF